MNISNADVENCIYSEALSYYPELFGIQSPHASNQSRNINSAGLLSNIYSSFDLPAALETEVIAAVVSAATPAMIPDTNAYSTRFRTDARGKAYPPLDLSKIRSDFPILDERVNGKKLIWFDNAATTQKPSCVINRLRYFYEHENSNVHRAAHTLARRTTDAYEGARRIIADFLNAPRPEDIVFVRGATEAINLIASSYGLANIKEGDAILISELEHHANIVPWQLLCKKTGARLNIIPVDDSGQIVLSEYQRLLTSRTKIVAFAHVSNVLGTVTPAEEMIRLAHIAGAKVVMDGAQAVSHLPVDVKALDCDFYVFSGHKIFGPTGIGVLYGKTELLEVMNPYQGGGNMISSVTIEESRFKKPPHKFEAGTGSIADAVGLGCAVDYVSQLGLKEICRYERELLMYMTSTIGQMPGISIIGNAASKSGIVSFYAKNCDSDELAEQLDREGIAVRAGHHCAQPVLRRFGCDKVIRASLALYNTFEEIDIFISALYRAISHPLIFPSIGSGI